MWWFKLRAIVFLSNQRLLIALFNIRIGFTIAEITLHFTRKLNMSNHCHSLALQAYPYMY